MAIGKGAMETVDMSSNFWEGKRVLVTGHTGFKGGWLSIWLQNLGAEVTGYALDPIATPSLFHVARVAGGMHSVIGDIRDAGKLARAFEVARPEIVIHMAAQALVRYSYTDPIETYAVNVMGTVNVLEAVRQSPSVRAVVNVTSDKCYENREWVWGYRENEPMGGHDPYSSSKGCAELVSAAYRSSYFNPKGYSEHGVALATARAGNVIGGGDWAEDRLIPDVVRAIAAGKPVKIRNPHAVRPWQHVLEPLNGYLMLAEKLYTEGAVFAEGWNFGPDASDTRSVQWITEQLAALCGGGVNWNLDSDTHPHEAHYLKLDCAKARQQLGWSPRWTLAIALERVLDWHRAHLANGDMRSITKQQIGDYMARSQ